jgi:glycosyltransferase involved in cell wall biosynthesis
MAAGKAVVSTSVDGCREVLEDGTNGLLVPPREPRALAAALARVLEDAALRRRLGENALVASRRYDVSACVRQIQDVYEEALASPRSGRRGAGD